MPAGTCRSLRDTGGRCASLLREFAGRNAQPTAMILDSRTIQSSPETTNASQPLWPPTTTSPSFGSCSPTCSCYSGQVHNRRLAPCDRRDGNQGWGPLPLKRNIITGTAGIAITIVIAVSIFSNCGTAKKQQTFSPEHFSCRYTPKLKQLTPFFSRKTALAELIRCTVTGELL